MMDFSEVKKNYSWLGISYLVFTVVAELAALLIKYVVGSIDSSIMDNSWLLYLLGLAPIWVAGFPLCLLCLKKLPAKKPEDNKIKFRDMLQLYCIITFLAIAANMVGLTITSAIEKLTGLTIQNTTIDIVNEQELLPTIIFAVIIGPILEELAFRKVLIDKLGQYNKSYTIILSGLMFGLFHTNLYQFFYATIIGIMFAYIYTISGRIRYSMILHTCLNFIHGVIPIILMKLTDIDAFKSLLEEGTSNPEVQEKMLDFYSDPGFLLFMAYAYALFAIVIAGFVLVIIWIIKKKFNVDESESILPYEKAPNAVFGNIGFILFTVTIIGITIYEIIQLQ